ncbi:nitrilase-related carbon-nitrogen hydrolase [Desulfonatronovibrio hydrogenovorans]|uniref:nitrilase-related carbon-nitrogen hydrolase n=1 Tax=Desulfonatronovibrio hydrogenovorans TaxID=53245 RepID=UPI00048E3FC5|nr:nitrilase-related carbon-nitrogen hydrolase [Desulfonatronovibrio hydrogenovorans]
METLSVGVCQTPVFNKLEEISPWLDKISNDSPGTLWIFPELFLGGFDYENKEAWAEKSLELQEVMTRFAADTGNILGGSLWDRQDEKYYNTFYLFTPDRGALKVYSKLHLFLPGKENQYFTAGSACPDPFVHHGIKIGFAICHDLRYPELFLHQQGNEPDIFIVNAQWPLARIEHWLTLLRARAIENQCYVLACNGMGNSALGRLAGHSCLITSWGRTRFIINEEPGMKKAELEEEVIVKDREMFDSRRSPFFELRLKI